jgi:hypothetical protein
VVLLCRAFPRTRSTPKYTSPTADARIAFAYTFPPRPERRTTPGYRKYSFLTWVPDTVVGVSFIACSTGQTSRSSGQKLTLAEICSLSCDKKLNRTRIFLHSLYMLWAHLVRFGKLQFDRFYTQWFRWCEDYSITALTSSLASQMKVISTANAVALLPQPSKVAPHPAACRGGNLPLPSWP